MTAADTTFTNLLGALEGSDARFEAAVPEDWLQGRTVYGGLALALGLEAAQRCLPQESALRSAQVAFMGPARGRIALRVTPLRQGRNVVFLGVDLSGADGLATHMILCFGRSRPSRLSGSTCVMPKVPMPEDCPAFIADRQAPRFLDHFELRMAGGERPASSGTRGEMLVWVRHRDEAARQGLIPLVALADALPPAIVTRLDAMVPLSSMTWQIEPLVALPRTRDGWWLMQSVADGAGDGYAAQTMRTWSVTGEAALAARQAVAVFA